MTLHDLIMNDLVKDDEKIRIIMPLVGGVSVVRGGFWYNDQILDFQNNDICEFSWSKEKGWTVTLTDTEIEPKELPF